MKIFTLFLTLIFFNISSNAEVFPIPNDKEVSFDDLSWVPFNSTGREDTTVTPAEDNTTFKEYKYSTTGLNEFTAFQIKVVMKGTNSSYPPVIRDLRGIALAV